MAGLPVLATPLDTVADLLTTYKVGKIVPALAPEAIGATMNAILADHAALTSMRRNTLKAVRDDLCWEKERQKLLDLYQQVLAKPNIYALSQNNREIGKGTKPP